MINNGILLWGGERDHEALCQVGAPWLKRDKFSIITYNGSKKKVDMNYQVNGEGSGLYKNAERHWI